MVRLSVCYTSKEARVMTEVRYIRCKDSDDLIELMHEYEAEGYDTDFCYEKDGIEGFWLEVKERIE